MQNILKTRQNLLFLSLLPVLIKLQSFALPKILGRETEKLSFEITHTTGLDAGAIEINELALYNAEIYKTIINNLAEEFFPSFIIIGHTPRGLDFASGLAVRMKAACITCVEGLIEAGGKICFRRQMFYGKINAHITADSEPVIITVQPGTFEPYKPDNASPGRTETRRVEPKQRDYSPLLAAGSFN